MAEEIYRVVGRNIRERRLALGWSLERLGEHLKVSYQQVQKYEKGINRLPTHMLVALAGRFGCSTDDLCGLALKPCPPEAAELMRRFSRISSPELQKGILALVSAMADDLEAPLG